MVMLSTVLALHSTWLKAVTPPTKLSSQAHVHEQHVAKDGARAYNSHSTGLMLQAFSEAFND